jgi:hypothetical protein
MRLPTLRGANVVKALTPPVDLSLTVTAKGRLAAETIGKDG